MKQLLVYGKTNRLAYAVYGNQHGYPLLVQHGMIASISDYHLFDCLIDLGVRLICMAPLYMLRLLRSISNK